MINKSSTFFGLNASKLMGWNNNIQSMNIPTNIKVDGGLSFRYGEDFGSLIGYILVSFCFVIKIDGVLNFNIMNI